MTFSDQHGSGDATSAAAILAGLTVLQPSEFVSCTETVEIGRSLLGVISSAF